MNTICNNLDQEIVITLDKDTARVILLGLYYYSKTIIEHETNKSTDEPIVTNLESGRLWLKLVDSLWWKIRNPTEDAECKECIIWTQNLLKAMTYGAGYDPRVLENLPKNPTIQRRE